MNVMILPELWMASGSELKLFAPQKRNDVPLFWYATLVLSENPPQQILVHDMARMATMWHADSLVD